MAYSEALQLEKEDLSFGVSRIYEVFRQTDRTELNVFRDIAEALVTKGSAGLIEHEMDHLNGVLYIDYQEMMKNWFSFDVGRSAFDVGRSSF